MTTDGERQRFYRDGLKFSCSRCSSCCRFDSGYVWLTRKDLESLSEGLGMTCGDVVKAFCRIVDVGPVRQVSLDEQKNYDCVFWKDGGCQVYEHRPVQCRTFPFWSSHLDTRDDWDMLAAHCPGVNIGEVHSAEEIERALELRQECRPLMADDVPEIERW
jgi:hypothetical protein